MKLYNKIKKEIYPANLCIVTKNQSKESIMKYYNLGHRLFAENKAQELLKKIDLPNDINWHFIGHLQKNKVKYVVKNVNCIQSVDSIELLKEINKEALKLNKIMDVLIQFNISNENSKFGLKKEEAFDFFNEAIILKNVKIKGIMAMGVNSKNMDETEEVFKQSQNLFNLLKEKYPNIDTLSMGMSNDYNIAIKYSSNLVRIGSLLFNKNEENL